ncbi:MAG: ImmA/IrrE family metallo-endopeptidase [Candidatus Pelethousia sp.]|nr:ImmA/IrrE family metallo-endopeptidase [Candidatus Pelethousia sp.]
MSSYIFDMVEKCKRTHKTSDPFELADAVGAKVRYKELGKLKGLYLYDDRCRYILINHTLGYEDQRMVCAHELGHDRLHQHFAKAAPLKDLMMYDYTSKPEYEANIFAANLLVEDDEIIELARDYDLISIGGLLGINPNLITFKLASMKSRGYKINLSETPNGSFLRK